MDKGRKTVFDSPKDVVNRTEKPRGGIRSQAASSLLPQTLPSQTFRPMKNADKRVEDLQSRVPLPIPGSNLEHEIGVKVLRNQNKVRLYRPSPSQTPTTVEKNKAMEMEKAIKAKQRPPVTSYKCKAVMDKFCYGMLLQ